MKRQKIVFTILLVLLAGLAAIAVLRPGPGDGIRPASVPEATVTPKKAVDKAPEAPEAKEPATKPAAADAKAAPTADAAASEPGPDAGPSPDASATPAKPAEPPKPQSLSVVGLGWELLAPGLVANGGIAATDKGLFAEAGLRVRFAAAADVPALESALAKGGADEKGADVAVLPLPTFVATYERLRALSPELFFVVGRSRGRVALAAAQANALTTKRKKARLRRAGYPATFLALFVLDQLGVPPTELELLAPDKAGELPAGAFAAVELGRKPKRGGARPGEKVLLTSADTPTLIPFVAIAPKGFVAKRRQALTAFSRVWLAGARKMLEDVPAAARAIAKQQGAPPVVELIERLGRIDLASFHDNARYAGLSGRTPVTIEELFRRTWRLWRGAGVLKTPPPETVPLNNALVMALAAEQPGAARAPAATARPPIAAGKDAEVLFAVSVPRKGFDQVAFVNRLGFLASTFERSVLRVATRKHRRTPELVREVADRFGLDPARITVLPKETKLGGLVEISRAQ